MFLAVFAWATVGALELVVVRHGQTEWNDLGYFQGAADIPLDKAGRAQARDARSKFAQMRFCAIYSSGLARAVETAQVLCEGTGLAPIKDLRWNEISFGEFEGKRPQDVDRSQIDACLELPAGQGMRGVEPLEAFSQRLSAALDELIERHARDERVLLVTHGGVMRWLIEKLLENDAELSTRYKNLEYFSARLDQDGVLRTITRG